MDCEVCGQEIRGRPLKVIVEGALLSVCRECAYLGKPHTAAKPLRPKPPVLARPSTARPIVPTPERLEGLEVVEDYHVTIREARERMGVTQEELAKKINEKLSVIQKIEAGKLVPSIRLARLLEHTLKVKLVTPATEEAMTTSGQRKAQAWR